jgi:hypothetical protein
MLTYDASAYSNNLEFLGDVSDDKQIYMRRAIQAMNSANGFSLVAASQLGDEAALRDKQERMAVEVMKDLSEYDPRLISKCPSFPYI